MRLDAKQLRIAVPTEEELKSVKRRPIWLVLDNILDTYNIGGLFRLSEAIAASEMILCGGSEKPPSSRIHKAAVGTENWVPWRYFSSTREALEQLKTENPQLKIIAVEQDARSIPIGEVEVDGAPIAVVVGHETDGVGRDALDMADVIAEIPMWGVNKSLNVIVSAGIAVYTLMGKCET